MMMELLKVEFSIQKRKHSYSFFFSKTCNFFHATSSFSFFVYSICIVIEKHHLLLFMLEFDLYKTIVKVVQHIQFHQQNKLCPQRLPILHQFGGPIQEIIE